MQPRYRARSSWSLLADHLLSPLWFWSNSTLREKLTVLSPPPKLFCWVVLSSEWMA